MDNSTSSKLLDLGGTRTNAALFEDMHVVLREAALLSLLISSLAACENERPETVEFFERLTGLPLCKTAQVRNFRVGEYDREFDFTYGVTLKMSDDCHREFVAEIDQRLDYECQPAKACSFMDSNSYSYEITPLEDGRTKFVLRTI